MLGGGGEGKGNVIFSSDRFNTLKRLFIVGL